ncbi:hypothetical protein A9Q78_10435 [Methylophaga sp. 41_12_T18]|nr:hypothetical protein A9Q78_10435 [Methylophaga sp. 41_12_T18]
MFLSLSEDKQFMLKKHSVTKGRGSAASITFYSYSTMKIKVFFVTDLALKRPCKQPTKKKMSTKS